MIADSFLVTRAVREDTSRSASAGVRANAQTTAYPDGAIHFLGPRRVLPERRYGRQACPAAGLSPDRSGDAHDTKRTPVRTAWPLPDGHPRCLPADSISLPFLAAPAVPDFQSTPKQWPLRGNSRQQQFSLAASGMPAAELSDFEGHTEAHEETGAVVRQSEPG